MKDIVNKLKEYINSNKLNVYDIAYIDNEETYYEKINPSNTTNNSYSVSKSFCASVVGSLIDEGLLSLDTLIMPIFLSQEQYQDYDKKWDDVTVGNLLLHSFGQEKGYMFEEEVCDSNITNWNKEIFARKLGLSVGETMVYSNVGCYLLAQVCEIITKEKFVDLIRKRIFEPLNFRDFGIVTCLKGNVLASTGMILRTIDCAKFGYMYACNGEYKGKRILSSEWISLAQKPQVLSEEESYYTYGCFWINGNDKEYFADGAYGQMILIDPINKYSLAIHSYMKIRVKHIVKHLLHNK